MVTSKTLSLSNFHTLAPNTVGWERHLNRLRLSFRSTNRIPPIQYHSRRRFWL